MERISPKILVQEGKSLNNSFVSYLFCIRLVTRHLFKISAVTGTMKVVSQKMQRYPKHLKKMWRNRKPKRHRKVLKKKKPPTRNQALLKMRMKIPKRRKIVKESKLEASLLEKLKVREHSAK